MKLLSATPSPYARKVRIALAEKGIAFELVTEVPWNPGAEVPQYNPLGKVPALVLDDGTTLFDSRLILEYLELKHPEPRLLPEDIDRRIAAKRFEVLADGVCDAVVLILLERMRPVERQSTAWVERQRAKVDAGIAEIAAKTARPFVLGPEFGHADIAVGAMLGYLDLRLPEVPWRERYPSLVALMARLSARPSFAATAPVAQQIAAGVA